MDATGILNLITGLLSGIVLFIFGMNVMSDSLTQIAGGKLTGVIEKVTGNRYSGWGFGTALAVFMQSSVTTVMTVGLVNSGIMSLAQSVGVMIGANMGTTATAWLLSLNSLGGAFWIQLLKPSSFTPFLAMGGIIVLMIAKSNRTRTVGNLIVGFSVMMIGMNLMSSAVEPLQEVPAFNELMVRFTNPFLGVLVGILCTFLIQSSAAAIGILQALAMTVGITFGVSIPIICGAQLGTCLTAILVSLGSNRNGKRAALVHLFYNLIRNTVFLVILYALHGALHLPLLSMKSSAVSIAAFHSLLNLAGSIIFLPLGSLMVRLVERVLPFSESERQEQADTLTILNPIFLANPSFAIDQVKTGTEMLADAVQEYFAAYLRSLTGSDTGGAARVELLGQKAMRYAEQLHRYCIRISGQRMDETPAADLSFLQSTVNDFREITDKVTGMRNSIENFRKSGGAFSEEATQDLLLFGNAAQEIVDITVQGYTLGNTRLAGTIQAYREIITDIHGKINKKHVRRLHSGMCERDNNLIFSELGAGYERIIDRCDSIAGHMKKRAGGSDDRDYSGQYETVKELFRDKYSILEEE